MRLLRFPALTHSYSRIALNADIYGQGSGYSERVMLLYDGLHYDALAVAAYDGAPEQLDVTVIPASGSRTDMVMQVS
jgi:ubiquitin thioesterase OTU1